MEHKRKLMVRDLGNPRDVLKMTGQASREGQGPSKTPDKAGVYEHAGRMVLGVMLGTVTKIRVVTNSSGDEVETMTGDFMGTTWAGEPKVRAQTMSLPQAWSAMVTNAYYMDGAESAVEFAIEVGVTRDPDATLGWTWSLNPIIRPGGSDSVGRLHAAVMAYYDSPVVETEMRREAQGMVNPPMSPELTEGTGKKVKEKAH